MKYILLTIALTAVAFGQFTPANRDGSNITAGRTTWQTAILPDKASSTGKYLMSTGTGAATWETLTVPSVDNAAVNAAIATNVVATRLALNSTIANVKDFGATGDGVTDDTAAINLASNSLKLTGGRLYFPRGTYIVRITANNTELPWGASAYPKIQTGPRPCFQVYSNTFVEGDGIDVSIIQYQNNLDDGPMINLSMATNVIFRNFTLDGNRARRNATTGGLGGESEGIDTKDDCSNLIFDSIKVVNIPNEGVDLDNSFWDLDGYSIYFRNCVFQDIGGQAIHNANWSVIESCRFINAGHKRYLGAIAGYAGTSGQGAIDGAGENLIIRGSFFRDCVRGLHIYRKLGDTSSNYLGKATGALTLTGNPLVGESVSVAGQTYTWSGIGRNFTAVGSTDVFTVTAHGWPDTTPVRFLDTPNGGVLNYVTYYVSNSTANTFTLSATAGGAVIDIATGIVAGRITNDWPTTGEVALGETANQSAINLTQSINGDWAKFNAPNPKVRSVYAAPSLATGTPAIVRVISSQIGTADATLTMTSIPTAAQVITVAGQAYTWRASVSTTANELMIGASASASMDNLVAAINGASGSGTTYGSATVASTIIEATKFTSTTMPVQYRSQDARSTALNFASTTTNGTWASGGANLGNLISLAESSSNTTASGALLTGGGTRVERQIKIDSCVFEDWVPAVSAVQVDTPSGLTVSNSVFTGSGVAVSSGGIGTRITNCDITFRDNLNGSTALIFTGVDGLVSGTRIIGGTIAADGNGSGFSVIGCAVESAYSSISIIGATASNMRFVGNVLKVSGTTATGANATDPVISLATTGQSAMVVSGNRIFGAPAGTSGSNGINCNASNSTISGNIVTVYQTGAAYPTGISLTAANITATGNHITATSTFGMQLSAAATGCAVTGNIVSGSQPLVNNGVNNTLSGNIGGGIPFHTYRSGTPETFVTAVIGSTCTDTATGNVYRKTSGSGNTGWVTP